MASRLSPRCFFAPPLAAAVALTVTAARSADQESVSLDRIVVTGSHIANIEIEGALPIQVISREEIERSGAVTMDQLLARVPANFNGANVALSINNTTDPGLSNANLRGLGGGSTLVLLNGRRIANYAFNGAAVDLNTIPLAAIERVEILKDGASAIYGSDAIAGVINFILRSNYQGVTVGGELSVTQHGGGDSGIASVALGIGDLARNGYNVFGLVTYQKEQSLDAADRDFTSSPANRLDGGLNALNGQTFPANIVDRNGRRILNPTAASGCAPPLSVPALVFPFYTPACAYYTTYLTSLLPEVDRLNALLRGTWRVSPEMDVFVEALVGRNTFAYQQPPSEIPTVGTFGMPVYPASGPYYPSAFASANGLSGNLLLSYRAVELGPRTNTTTTEAQRYVLGAEGQVAGWSYNVAAVYSYNNEENAYGGGWLYLGRAVAAMRTGLINPWGPSGPAGQALLESLVYNGTPQSANGTTSQLNAFASRDIFNLPAGPLALAIGGEVRREHLAYDWDPAVLSGDTPITGQLKAVSGSRSVLAGYAELSVPIVRALDAQLAVRWDDYSDFGSTTNPKVAMRWQPLASVLMRASWGTGFRAPGLYQLSEPTSNIGVVAPVRDPIRCPVTGRVDDCFAIIPAFSGGNPDLQPETSTQWNAGVVFQPLRQVSFGVDYWNVHLEDTITQLDPNTVVKYYDSFASRIVRGPPDPSVQGLPGPIVAIDSTLINLGQTQTSGFDVALNWTPPVTSYGNFAVNLQGTYVLQWDTSVDGINQVSRLADARYGLPVPRWRSTLTFDWNLGPWGATVSQVYTGGYTDVFPLPAGQQTTIDVESYSIWNLQATYAGFAGWRLAVGIRNLFDTEPPFSSVYGIGYNRRVADPRGRVFYLRATFTMK